jgi:hypothetical protein
MSKENAKYNVIGIRKDGTRDIISEKESLEEAKEIMHEFKGYEALHSVIIEEMKADDLTWLKPEEVRGVFIMDDDIIIHYENGYDNELGDCFKFTDEEVISNTKENRAQVKELFNIDLEKTKKDGRK